MLTLQISEKFFKQTILTLGYHAIDICQIIVIVLNKKGSQKKSESPHSMD